MDAARGFNKLRKENNWNKAVYTYSLACCIWEEYLVISGGTAPTEESELTEEQRRLLGIVRNLMAMVPRLQRKVAGKSIPIEKFVIRKARKFQEQGDFLMRPGVELVASWNLFGKIPYYRLQALRGEIDTSIAELSQHQKQEDGSNGKLYRHKYYYDDLATLLLLKANCLHEISMPSCIYNLKPPAADEQEAKENAAKAQADEAVQMQPELSLAAADTYLRLLRLSPLIERDHYLVATARFCLGSLYLSAHAIDSEWAGLARAQWKCVVGGKPITAAPFLSLEEYRLHKDRLQRDEKEGDGTKNDAFAAYGCLVEEQILQNSGHASLRFYEDGHTVSGWSHCPAYWSDSKKYSLQNALEVRTFNSENRLSEALASSKAGI
ncbi:hypothetical protein LPJ75_002581 [Coemansia sp. RSA 2598]|nr:hypothetical protein LPJ75_002581 [Coemansia sp. RSA 2598]